MLFGICLVRLHKPCGLTPDSGVELPLQMRRQSLLHSCSVKPVLASRAKCTVASHAFEWFLPTDQENSEGKLKVTKGVYDDLIEQILAILLESQGPKDLYLCSLLFQEEKKKQFSFFLVGSITAVYFLSNGMERGCFLWVLLIRAGLMIVACLSKSFVYVYLRWKTDKKTDRTRSSCCDQGFVVDFTSTFVFLEVWQ